MSDWHAVALAIPCTYCGAAPGDRCRVVAGRTQGRVASYLHAARTEPWMIGHREGFAVGMDSGHRRALHDLIHDLEEQKGQRPGDTFTRGDIVTWLRGRLERLG